VKVPTPNAQRWSNTFASTQSLVKSRKSFSTK